MAKMFGEKLKILYLRDFLLKYSDENHPVTLQDILSYLTSLDIAAERKSIYSSYPRFYTSGSKNSD